jgi:heme exporter protein C
VLRADGPTIAPALLWPLLIMAIAFTILFIVLHLKAMRAEVLRRRCDAMIAVNVRGSDAAQDRGGGEAVSHV